MEHSLALLQQESYVDAERAATFLALSRKTLLALSRKVHTIIMAVAAVVVVVIWSLQTLAGYKKRCLDSPCCNPVGDESLAQIAESLIW